MYVYVTVWIVLLVWASLIDLKEFRLPDWITLPLIVSGVILLGIMIGYGLLRLVDECYFKITKRRGIGQGDAKLLAAIGATLGWQAIFPILCFASILGLIVGLILIKFKRLTLQNPIPFGPFLSIFACAFILDKVLLAGP